MDNKKICIVHFRSIDKYPPIYNLLRILDKNSLVKQYTVITSKFTLENNFNNINFKQIDISSSIKLFRYIQYVFFYLKCFWYFISIKPSTILYFESLSAIPCIIYKNLYKNIKLLVHYHEYTTPEEYKNGMVLDRISYQLEKLNSNKYSWFSHTNAERLQFFSNDFGGLPKDKLKVMTNYPLLGWAEPKFVKRFKTTDKIQLVYIGAISFEDTYIKEILHFVKMNEKDFNIELYSFNLSDDVRNYIFGLNSFSIKYSGTVSYNLIPTILKNKDIGLILYKANTLNYIYNAPNKLFEYLSCGLDVWYPYKMKGCDSFQSDIFPKVTSVNFTNIQFDLLKYKSEKTIIGGSKLNLYTAENATKELINFINA